MQPLPSSKTTSPWTEIFAPPDGAAAPPAAEPVAAPAGSTPAQADLPAQALFDCYNA
ncbi:MAG: hypothetical protein ABI847_09630 [Anaerolineales bacterium]